MEVSKTLHKVDAYKTDRYAQPISFNADYLPVGGYCAKAPWEQSSEMDR